eukprot:9963291-Alexandrium_andersonii.AAC.1
MEPWNDKLCEHGVLRAAQALRHMWGRTHAARNGVCFGVRREHRRLCERTSVRNAAALAQQFVQGMQSGACSGACREHAG